MLPSLNKIAHREPARSARLFDRWSRLIMGVAERAVALVHVEQLRFAIAIA